MSELLARIAVNPQQCGGRPCIRGMRIDVVDILELLAAGQLPTEIVAELPDLQFEDVQATLLYTARRFNHPIIAA